MLSTLPVENRGNPHSSQSRQVIAVLDYGIGNLRSAQKTLERAGAEPLLTADPAVVAQADGVVLPGVGNFGRVMEAIRDSGVDKLAHDAVESGRPFLGICVGMQALYESSDEAGGVEGLGILKGRVKLLEGDVKRPQMQWNKLMITAESPLLAGLDDGSWVYFVHSYAPEATNDVIATCEYGSIVTAAAQRANVYATQFHPEKSGPIGLKIIENFVALCDGGSRPEVSSERESGERSSRSDHVGDGGSRPEVSSERESGERSSRSDHVGDGGSRPEVSSERESGERSSRSDHVGDGGSRPEVSSE